MKLFFWVCKTLIRRQVGTAHNFANKPVFFACNGVQMRRRVSYKAGTKKTTERHEIAGTPRAPERKFYRRQHKGRRACLMIDGKRGRRGVAASRAQHGGRDKGKGAEATSGRGCAPWGNIRGGREKERAGVRGRKDDESKRFGVT